MRKEWIDQLQNEFGGALRRNVPMRDYTSFRLGGAADDESRLAYWQQAAQTMRTLREALDDAGVEARVQADLLDRMAYIEQIIARNIAAVQRRLR